MKKKALQVLQRQMHYDHDPTLILNQEYQDHCNNYSSTNIRNFIIKIRVANQIFQNISEINLIFDEVLLFLLKHNHLGCYFSFCFSDLNLFINYLVSNLKVRFIMQKFVATGITKKYTFYLFSFSFFIFLINSYPKLDLYSRLDFVIHFVSKFFLSKLKE